MRKHIFPIKDASIYEEYPNRQTGLDEILEIGKTNRGRHVVRSLLQFDITSFSQSIANGDYPSDIKFDLKLHLARAEKISLDQIVEVYPISESWGEGAGYFYQDRREETNGTTWKYRSTGSLWDSTGSTYHGLGTSSVFNGDLTFDVTGIVSDWISGSYPNYGFIVKYPEDDELDGTNAGRVYVFSKDTHTVFVPSLIAKWNNTQYETGSLEPAPEFSLLVKPIDLKSTYKKGQSVRINIKAREEYPEKTFANELTMFSVNRYLPTTSYYSIVDVQSQESIIPFDEYSRIECDADGNYIQFSTEKMWPLRYYKIVFKIDGPTSTQIFDNNFVFGIDI